MYSGDMKKNTTKETEPKVVQIRIVIDCDYGEITDCEINTRGGINRLMKENPVLRRIVDEQRA